MMETRNNKMSDREIKELAKNIRLDSIEMVNRANASHVAGALSIADVLAVLYGRVMRYRPNEPEWEDRDRLIFSKGHCCVAVYSVLARTGFYSLDELSRFGKEGSDFICHVSTCIPGVEMSTGSLGHGLPFAAGMALAAKRKGRTHSVYCIVGDGEMDEGSNWEALAFAAHNGLDNLCLIVDCNKMQALGTTSEVLNLSPLKEKLQSFNWHVEEIDGHDYGAITNALSSARNTENRPTVIIAHTIKGKGVSFMENTLKWHYSAPKDELFEIAIKELLEE